MPSGAPANITRDKPPSSSIFWAGLKISLPPSLVAIGLTHPLRIAHNIALNHPPKSSGLLGLSEAATTILKGVKNGGIAKGFWSNLFRGSTILTAQGVGKYVAQSAYGDDKSPEAKILGLTSAATFGSLAATIVEPPSTRITNQSATTYKVEQPLSWMYRQSQAGLSNHRIIPQAGYLPPFRINPAATVFFFGRDMGYGFFLRVIKDIPLEAAILLTPPAFLLAVMGQNLAIRANTDDMPRLGTGTYPKYSIATIPSTLKSIANGEFTHVSYPIARPNPKGFLDRAVNLLYVTCGPHIVMCRGTYLASVAIVYNLADSYLNPKPPKPSDKPLIDGPKNRARFFADPKKLLPPQECASCQLPRPFTWY